MLDKHPRAKSYRFTDIRNFLTSAFKHTAPAEFMRYKSVITKVINTYAKDHFSKIKGGSKHAEVYPWEVVIEIAEWLSKKDFKGLKAALVLLLTHAVGCRASEALDLQWEDWKEVTTPAGKFWTWDLRTSKTNVIPRKLDQLTYKRHPSKRIFENMFRNYYKCLGKPKKGYIFEGQWSKTCNVNYQLKLASKHFKLCPRISCHSGRNFATHRLIERGASEQTTRIFMRWAPNSRMLDLYRNNALETSKVGGANYLESLK